MVDSFCEYFFTQENVIYEWKVFVFYFVSTLYKLWCRFSRHQRDLAQITDDGVTPVNIMHVQNKKRRNLFINITPMASTPHNNWNIYHSRQGRAFVIPAYKIVFISK